VLLRMH